MKFYVCKRIKLLNWLMEKGFMFIEARKDKYNSNYNVWIFIETPELKTAVDEYYSNI